MAAEIPDRSAYLQGIAKRWRRTLPTLSPAEFAVEQEVHLHTDADEETFVGDFAIAAERRRRDLLRWTRGEPLPTATEAHTRQILGRLPAFVSVHAEAIGGMRLERAPRFRIDAIVEDIMGETAERLPRTIDTYEFSQREEHEETLAISGLGGMRVRLRSDEPGVFKTIHTLNTDRFSILNARHSGVTYLDQYDETSRPHEIQLKTDDTEIILFSQGPVRVTMQGKSYSNEGSPDSDILRRVEGYDALDPRGADWRTDNSELNWKEVENNAILWLYDNVLVPIRKAPKPEQQTKPPEAVPFPEHLFAGPLFTFMPHHDIERLMLLKSSPENAHPHERWAKQPDEALVPGTILPTPETRPIIRNVYTWCGIDTVDRAEEPQAYKKIGFLERRTISTALGDAEDIVTVKPKNATNIFVIDWRAWEAYREEMAKTRTTLSDEEFAENHAALVRTMVPVAEYDGSYQKPIILIARNLEFDEVEAA
jgi:hypothetical protein